VALFAHRLSVTVTVPGCVLVVLPGVTRGRPAAGGHGDCLHPGSDSYRGCPGGRLLPPATPVRDWFRIVRTKQHTKLVADAATNYCAASAFRKLVVQLSRVIGVCRRTVSQNRRRAGGVKDQVSACNWS
jgi:hypothetical protein